MKKRTMGKAKYVKIIILAIKTTIAILCWGCFIYLTKDIWNKFSNKFTSTGVRFSDQGLTSKALPCFTVCPWRGFKKKGFHFENKDFINSTFEQNELIEIFPVLNSDCVDVIAMQSIILGRCYTICCSKKVTKNEMTSIALIKGADVTGLFILLQNLQE